VEEIRESLRLAEHLDENGNLTPEIIERTLEISRVFARFCKARNVKDIVATATSAMREAKNGPLLAERLFDETGIRFKILSGEEEAYFGYQGVINSLSINDATILDIGGGSAEIVKVVNRLAEDLVSLPLGAITLTRQFLSPDDIESSALSKLESHLTAIFEGLPWLSAPPSRPNPIDKKAYRSRSKNSRSGKENNARKEAADSVLVGMGGTIRNIGKIYKRKIDYPLDLLHGLSVPMEEVEDIYKMLQGMTLAQRKDIPGLSQQRADIMVAGMSAATMLGRVAGAKELVISGRGLRDGLFLHHLLEGKGSGPLVDDPAIYSTRNLMRYYDVHEVHSHHIAQLALSLFDQLHPLHNLGFEHRRLLNIAALLHDVGIAVNYYNHGEHGLYLLTRTGIDGVTHRELVIIAYAVAAHANGGSPLKRWPEYKSLLEPRDETAIPILGAILRLAESLDRSESGSIQSLACQILPNGDTKIMPTVFTNGEFEIREAQNALPDVEKAFGSRFTLGV
jgi:exopolyphosphatase/guanosine-5'-triphosphate,3'-diphosphate pyrophosphatase